MDYLDREITRIEQVLSSTPEEHPLRTSRLLKLGELLYNRFKQMGSMDDLNRAIATTEEATKANESDSNLSVIISCLATFRRSRFDQTKSMDDLNAAIRMCDLAIGLAHGDPTRRVGVLRNLSGDVLTRFKHTGSMNDLDRAIVTMEDVITSTPNDDPLRAALLNNLMVMWRMRFERTESSHDLDRAIAVREQMVASTLEDRGANVTDIEKEEAEQPISRPPRSLKTCMSGLFRQFKSHKTTCASPAATPEMLVPTAAPPLTNSCVRDSQQGSNTAVTGNQPLSLVVYGVRDFRWLDDADATIRGSGTFQALVERSIIAWFSLNYVGPSRASDISESIEILRSLTSVEDVLANSKFWFFQCRESFVQQAHLSRWDSGCLDMYILLPCLNGFVNKRDCFFISHYWRTTEHPDPEGQDMRNFLHDLRAMDWSYIWVDWTCLPQAPRSEKQRMYFNNMLQFIPTLIRECTIEYRFPPFEPRAWILLEVAYYFLTHSGQFAIPEDIATFFSHVQEMRSEGVYAVISKYSYVCTNGSDLTLIIAWLELLVILTRVFPNATEIRNILKDIEHEGIGGYTVYYDGGPLHVDKSKGILLYNGTKYEFTPMFNLREGASHAFTIQ